MDVSIRARLEQNISKEGDKAEKSLKGVERASKRIGRTSGGKRTGRGVAKLGEQANLTRADIERLIKAAQKVGKIKTDRAQKELKKFAQEARRTGKIVKKLGEQAQRTSEQMKKIRGSGTRTTRQVNALYATNAKASLLDKTIGGIGTTATSAMGTFAAAITGALLIRGLNNLAEKAKEVNREIAGVASIMELNDAPTRAKIQTSNEAIGVRYGMSPVQVNKAREVLAASGIDDLEAQEAALPTITKASKATGSDPSTLANATASLINNLGVAPKDVAAAMDIMAKGGKLGAFELEDMAANFPTLGTKYAQSGRTGLDAVAELVAMAEVSRLGAGTSSQAATNLDNFLAKIFAPDAQKNFKEKGVDLATLKKRTEAEDTPFAMAVVEELMRVTGGDQFKIGEIFGDVQVKNFLGAMIANREKYDEFLAELKSSAKGTIDRDYGNIEDLNFERSDRRKAAMERLGRKSGDMWAFATDPILDTMIGAVDAEFDLNERDIRERVRLRTEQIDGMIADLAEKESRLNTDFPNLGHIVQPGRVLLEDEIKKLKADIQKARELQGVDGTTGTGTGTGTGRGIDGAGKPTDRIAIPTPRPDKLASLLDADLGPVAQKNMDEYRHKLEVGGRAAIAQSARIAAQMKANLSFDATPNIRPNYSPTSSGGRRSDRAGGGGKVSVTQNITSSANPVSVAARAQRRQDRAIRTARAGALHDTGGMA